MRRNRESPGDATARHVNPTQLGTDGDRVVSIALFVGIGVGVFVVVLYAAIYLRARRRGVQKGATRILRCSDGHLFTSTFIPGASFRAVRLGASRYQRCPVGNHWSLVATVDPATLTAEQRAAAAQFRDSRIP
ncbi:MAG TPA: hypothetical protein VEY12_09585 [Thermoplasmata archaeon]|nr:hypothetical protein [Thermoplasmata archaeon]